MHCINLSKIAYDGYIEMAETNIVAKLLIKLK